MASNCRKVQLGFIDETDTGEVEKVSAALSLRRCAFPIIIESFLVRFDRTSRGRANQAIKR
jgi:hypothetical protein